VTKEFAVTIFLNCLRASHRRHHPNSDFIIPEYRDLPMPAKAALIEAFDNYNRTLGEILKNSP
jgi:hypothetical protein